MYNDPKLSTPVFAACFSAFFLWIAWKVKFPDWLQAVLVIIGVALALVAFVTGGDYLITKFERHLEGLRSAWFAPIIMIADKVERMTPAQLAFIQEVVPLRMVGKFGVEDELSWWVSAPHGDVPLSFLGEYLEQCQEEGWETLVPQHGMSDSMEREYVKRIHELMFWRGFATKPAGNMRAKWLVAPSVVYQKMGLEE